MNLRDTREQILRSKLKMIAREIGDDPEVLIAAAVKYGLIQDVREMSTELHIHLEGATLQTVESVVRDILVKNIQEIIE